MEEVTTNAVKMENPRKLASSVGTRRAVVTMMLMIKKTCEIVHQETILTTIDTQSVNHLNIYKQSITRLYLVGIYKMVVNVFSFSLANNIARPPLNKRKARRKAGG